MGQTGANLPDAAMPPTRDISQIASPMKNMQINPQGPSKLRQFASIAGSGLNGAAQNMPQPQQGGSYSPIAIPEAPQVDSSYFQPTNLGIPRGPRPNSLFFGSGGY